MTLEERIATAADREPEVNERTHLCHSCRIGLHSLKDHRRCPCDCHDAACDKRFK